MLRVQMFLFCTHVCTVPPCSCGTGTPRGTTVAHSCSRLLSRSLSAVFFWDSLFLRIRNGNNSAAQAAFASGSEDRVSVCYPWRGGAIWPCLDSRAVMLHCLELQLLLMGSQAVLEWQPWQLGASLWQMEHASVTPVSRTRRDAGIAWETEAGKA